MNNKGFTLAELLAIVVILSIIVVLAAPNIGKQIKKDEENSKSVLNDKIENASKLYIAKYYAKKVANGDLNVSFTLDDLQRDGLLNLRTNDGCKEDNNTIGGSINVKIETGKIKYNFSGISNDNKCYDCTGINECTK